MRYDSDMKTKYALFTIYVLATLSAASGFAVESQLKKTVPSAVKTTPSGMADERNQSSVTTEQVLYQFLLSEIAGQRGRTALATQGMIDLAMRSGDARIARRATEMAFQSKQMGDAREALMLWLAIEPDSAVARQALSAIIGGESGLEKTTATVLQWLSDKEFEKKHAATLFNQLPFLYLRVLNNARNNARNSAQDKKAIAMAVAEIALPYPRLAEAQYAVGMTAMVSGDVAAAKIALSSALAIRGQFDEAAIAMARLLFASPENGEKLVEQYLTDYLKRYPLAVEVRIAYAQLLVGMKSLVALRLAREQFRLAANIRLDGTEIPYAIGLISLQIEDWVEAEKQLSLTLARNPRDKNPIYFNLGLAAEGRKDAEAARQWFQKITDGEYFINAQLKIAQIITERDGIKAGRTFLREARTAEKIDDNQTNDGIDDDTKQQLTLAEVTLLREAKAYVEAYQMLTEAVAAWPKSVALRYDRAMIAEKLNKFSAMEADLRTVITMKPDHAHAYNALGYSFADRGIKLDEALSLIQQAIKLSPQDAFIQDSLGWVFYRLGRHDEALAALKKAYAMRPDVEIAAHLSEVLFHIGNRDEAMRILQNALKNFPDHPALTAVMTRHDK